VIKDARLDMARRLDAFVDAAFAFAVTLLIAGGGDPPGSLEELSDVLLRAPAYAASFALIAMFWLGYRDLGRLWPTRDRLSTTLSLGVVFLVLLYVFPLRLMVESAFHALSGGRLPGGDLAGSFAEVRNLYLIYSSGFLVLSGLFAALYGHHLRLRPITETQATDGRSWLINWTILMSVALLSVLTAALAPPRIAVWAGGMVYMLIPIAIGVVSWIEKPRRAPTGAPVDTDGPTS
jgi:uncharacterized membrane protein